MFFGKHGTWQKVTAYALILSTWLPLNVWASTPVRATGALHSMTAPQAARELAGLIQTIRINEKTFPENFKYLEYARQAFELGQTPRGIEKLELFLASFPKESFSGSFELSPQARRVLYIRVATQHRKLANQQISNLLNGLRKALWQAQGIEAKFREQSLKDSLSWIRNGRIDRSISEVEDTLQRLEQNLKGARPTYVADFLMHKGELIAQFTDYLECLLNRFSTVEERAGQLDAATVTFFTGGPHGAHFQPNYSRMKTIIQAETGQELRRIWVNQGTIGAVGMAAFMVATVIFAAYAAPAVWAAASSGGVVAAAAASSTAAAAMPAAMATLANATVVTGTAIFLPMSASSLIERIGVHGLKESIKNVDTYFDLAMIFMSLPREIEGVSATAKYYRAYIYGHAVGTGAYIGARALYKFWEIQNADALAAAAQRSGQQVTAREIRFRAYLNLASAVVNGVVFARDPMAGMSLGQEHD